VLEKDISHVVSYMVSRSFWNFRLKGEFQVDFILPIPFSSFPMGIVKPLVVTAGGGALLRSFILCFAVQLQSVGSWFSLSRLRRGQSSLAPVSS